jgi:hypothetical protein
MSVIRRFHSLGPRLCLLGLTLALVVAISNGAIRGQPFQGNILRIGVTTALTGNAALQGKDRTQNIASIHQRGNRES